MLTCRPSYFAAVIIAAAALTLFSTVEGHAQNRETRDVEWFSQVSFAISGTLYITEGETQHIEVEADANHLDRIETVVEDGNLHVRGEEDSGWLSWLLGIFRGNESADVHVTVPSLEAVSISGSGDVVGETPLTADAFSLEIAGSGGARIQLDAYDVAVRIAGSGTSELNGTANYLKVDIAGSGNVRASDMDVARAEINVAGSGDCYVHARESIKASIMGSGDVFYRGEPTVEHTVMGSGSVRSVDS